MMADGHNILQSLKDAKLVLFGAGRNGRTLLRMLLAIDIEPICFIDNSSDIGDIECTGSSGKKRISVNPPEWLAENKEDLKIIITPGAPWNKEIENQLKGMGLRDIGLSVAALFEDIHEITNSKFRSRYDDFKNNYIPRELPELQLFRPYYPFGETAIVIGRDISKFTDFAKREGFVLTSCPQFRTEGACVISTYPLRLDRNGTAYTFSGNALYDGRFIVGINDMEQYVDIKDVRESLGEFELLIIDQEHIELGNDFFGMGKWFYYYKNNIFVAGTSYHLCLLLLKSIGVELSINIKYATANLGCHNWITEQLFSEVCEVNDILFLPPDKKLCIQIDGSIKLINTRFYQEANFSEEYDDARYEALLYRSREELIQNMTAIFSHPRFKHVVISLTDGLDTRTVLAAALNLPRSLQEKIRIFSLDTEFSKDDLRTACGIANMLALKWDDVVSEEHIIQQNSGINQSVISYNLGTYHVGCYLPRVSRLVQTDAIWLHGGNGETCTALAGQLDVLMYDQQTMSQEYLSQLSSGREFYDNLAAKECFAALIQVEWEKCKGNNSAVCADIFYQQFRNRLHFKNKYAESPAFHPLQSLSAYRAKKMSFQKGVSFAFQHDLIKILHPLLGNFPYLEPKQTNRIRFIHDHKLSFYPVGQFEIRADYSRKNYDEAKAIERVQKFPDETIYSESLASVQKKQDLYDWLYFSEEALLSCLKTIIGKFPELAAIGLEFFTFIHQYGYDHDDRNDSVFRNKLLSLYYQIQIISGSP